MRTFLLVLASALALTACQSSPSSSAKGKIPADVPAEENAAPAADTMKTR